MKFWWLLRGIWRSFKKDLQWGFDEFVKQGKPD